MAVTIDFETFYSKEYSLSKMTTEQYIKGDQFQIIGVSYKVNDEPAVWLTSSSLQVYKDALAFLKDEVVIAHNAMFDMAILSFVLDIKPKVIIDTLSMAKPHHNTMVGGSLKALAEHYNIGIKGTEVLDALGKRIEDFTPEELARYGKYCKNDVDLTWQLFQKLLPITPKREMQLIDRTIRLFTEPVLELDKAILTNHLSDVKAKRTEALKKVVKDHPDLIAQAFTTAGMVTVEEAARAMLASNPKLAEVLRDLGVEPPMKQSQATGNDTYAFGKTDKAFLALLEHEDVRVQAVVEARLDTKSSIELTRTESFLGMASRGAMPVPLSYCGAVTTWRWSGTDKVNLQNLPRGGALRHAIVAPEGYSIVACDSSNIELRVNHTLAGQLDTVMALREGKDLYCEFATMIFGRPITKADKMERMLGKICHLGLGYGMGHAKFAETVRIQSKGEIILDEAEAKRIVALWRSTYDKIPQLWKLAESGLAAIANQDVMEIGFGGLVTTTTDGLITAPENFIKYPNLRRQDGAWVYDSKFGRSIVANKIYGGKVIENICQHLARNIIAEQWLTIAKKYKVVLQVHDEIVVVVPTEIVPQAMDDMISIMSQSPSWWPDVPLAAEASHGRSYGDAK